MIKKELERTQSNNRKLISEIQSFRGAGHTISPNPRSNAKYHDKSLTLKSETEKRKGSLSVYNASLGNYVFPITASVKKRSKVM